MDYKFHENGWTVVIDNFDMNDATQDDIHFICRLLSKHTLVLLKNQKGLALEKRIRNNKNVQRSDTFVQ